MKVGQPGGLAQASNPCVKRWRRENKKLVQIQTELQVKFEINVGIHEILPPKNNGLEHHH